MNAFRILIVMTLLTVIICCSNNATSGIDNSQNEITSRPYDRISYSRWSYRMHPDSSHISLEHSRCFSNKLLENDTSFITYGYIVNNGILNIYSEIASDGCIAQSFSGNGNSIIGSWSLDSFVALSPALNSVSRWYGCIDENARAQTDKYNQWGYTEYDITADSIIIKRTEFNYCWSDTKIAEAVKTATYYSATVDTIGCNSLLYITEMGDSAWVTIINQDEMSEGVTLTFDYKNSSCTIETFGWGKFNPSQSECDTAWSNYQLDTSRTELFDFNKYSKEAVLTDKNTAKFADCVKNAGFNPHIIGF